MLTRGGSSDPSGAQFVRGPSPRQAFWSAAVLGRFGLSRPVRAKPLAGGLLFADECDLCASLGSE